MVSAMWGHAALRLRRGVTAVDRIELMQMLLGHPEADVRVDLGDLLLYVRDVRYSAGRGGDRAAALPR
jgi:hypothetical protein